MKPGDLVVTPGFNGEIGTGEVGKIVRQSTHPSFDWWVELPAKGDIPPTEMPFTEEQLVSKQ